MTVRAPGRGSSGTRGLGAAESQSDRAPAEAETTPLSPRTQFFANAISTAVTTAVTEATKPLLSKINTLETTVDQLATTVAETNAKVHEIDQTVQSNGGASSSSSGIGSGGQKRQAITQGGRSAKAHAVAAALGDDELVFSLTAPSRKEAQLVLDVVTSRAATVSRVLLQPFSDSIFLNLEVPSVSKLTLMVVDKYLAVEEQDGGAGLIDKEEWGRLDPSGQEQFAERLLSVKIDPSKPHRYECLYEAFFGDALYSKEFNSQLKNIVIPEYTNIQLESFKAAFTGANTEFKANGKVVDLLKPEARKLEVLLEKAKVWSQLPNTTALKITPRMGYSPECKTMLTELSGYGNSIGQPDLTLLHVFKPGLPTVFGKEHNGPKWLVAEPSFEQRLRVPDDDDDDDGGEEDEEEEYDWVEVPHPLCRCVSKIEERMLGGAKMEAKGYAATAFFIQQLMGVKTITKGSYKGGNYLSESARYDNLGSLLNGMHVWMQSPTLCPTNHSIIKDGQTRNY